MTGLSFLLALAATGVEFDWKANERGELDYVVQVDAERMESSGDSTPARHVVRRDPLGDPNYASALGNSQYGNSQYGGTQGFSSGSAAYTSGQTGSYNQAAGYGQANPYGQTNNYAQNRSPATTAASPPSLLGQRRTVTATNDPAARSSVATTGSAWSDRNWNHAGAAGSTAASNTSLNPNGLNTAINNAVNNAASAGQSAWNDAQRRAASAANGVADSLGSRFGATSPTTGLPNAPDPRYASQPGYNEAAVDPRYGATGYNSGTYGNMAPVGQGGTQLGGTQLGGTQLGGTQLGGTQYG
ncbi:MAG: hypothetical protein KDA55_13585, partial [Planctomycetales bacterium]|nr:hypothetical protein [Planctomycetales bacterium]